MDSRIPSKHLSMYAAHTNAHGGGSSAMTILFRRVSLSFTFGSRVSKKNLSAMPSPPVGYFRPLRTTLPVHQSLPAHAHDGRNHAGTVRHVAVIPPEREFVNVAVQMVLGKLVKCTV